MDINLNISEETITIDTPAAAQVHPSFYRTQLYSEHQYPARWLINKSLCGFFISHFPEYYRCSYGRFPTMKLFMEGAFTHSIKIAFLFISLFNSIKCFFGKINTGKSGLDCEEYSWSESISTLSFPLLQNRFLLWYLSDC